MTIELDHVIVSARNRDASARQLAQLLGVPCGPAREGPFFAVHVNDGLTLDFILLRAESGSGRADNCSCASAMDTPITPSCSCSW